LYNELEARREAEEYKCDKEKRELNATIDQKSKEIEVHIQDKIQLNAQID